MSKKSTQIRNNKVTSLAAKPMMSGKYLNAKNITTQNPINSNMTPPLLFNMCILYSLYTTLSRHFSPIGRYFAHRNQAVTNN